MPRHGPTKVSSSCSTRTESPESSTTATNSASSARFPSATMSPGHASHREGQPLPPHLPLALPLPGSGKPMNAKLATASISSPRSRCDPRHSRGRNGGTGRKRNRNSYLARGARHHRGPPRESARRLRQMARPAASPGHPGTPGRIARRVGRLRRKTSGQADSFLRLRHLSDLRHRATRRQRPRLGRVCRARGKNDHHHLRPGHLAGELPEEFHLVQCHRREPGKARAGRIHRHLDRETARLPPVRRSRKSARKLARRRCGGRKQGTRTRDHDLHRRQRLPSLRARETAQFTPEKFTRPPPAPHRPGCRSSGQRRSPGCGSPGWSCRPSR